MGDTTALRAAAAAIATGITALGTLATDQNTAIQQELAAINAKLATLPTDDQAALDEITASLTAVGDTLNTNAAALAANTQTIKNETTALGS